jgi:hypothetical protein
MSSEETPAPPEGRRGQAAVTWAIASLSLSVLRR